MKTKNILLVIVAAIFALSLTSCYEKFGTAGPAKRYDDNSFPDYQKISIAELKALFTDPANKLTDINGNIVAGQSPVNTASYGKYYLNQSKRFIKGKVISNDAFGNFFRGIFILDDAGDGIEVKVGVNGMHTKYVVGETIYVLCDGLAIGNYRSVLSIGLEPKAEDKSDSQEPYANKYMEVPTIIAKHVKLGAETKLVALDTVVIKTTDSYNDAQMAALSGRLIRFEGLVSTWAGEYPSFLYKYEFNTYENFDYLTVMETWKAYTDGGSVGPAPTGIQRPEYRMPEPKSNHLTPPQPTWGFQERGGNNQSNFGSAEFQMSAYSGAGNILIRTSGYSRFAMDPITPDGDKVTVTGIVARYTDKGGNNLGYQITVNNVTDIKKVN